MIYDNGRSGQRDRSKMLLVNVCERQAGVLVLQLLAHREVRVDLQQRERSMKHTRSHEAES